MAPFPALRICCRVATCCHAEKSQCRPLQPTSLDDHHCSNTRAHRTTPQQPIGAPPDRFKQLGVHIIHDYLTVKEKTTQLNDWPTSPRPLTRSTRNLSGNSLVINPDSACHLHADQRGPHNRPSHLAWLGPSSSNDKVLTPTPSRHPTISASPPHHVGTPSSRRPTIPSFRHDDTPPSRHSRLPVSRRHTISAFRYLHLLSPLSPIGVSP